MLLSEVQSLVATTADPSFVVDGSGCIAAWNSAAVAMFGLSAREVIGRQCGEIVQGVNECGPVCSADCIVQKAVQQDLPVRNFDLQVPAASGMRWCNVSVLIVHGENPATRYSIHIVREIDIRKRLELLVRDFVVTGGGLSAEQATALISSTRSPAREADLSARERDVLKLLAKGVKTISIAKQLHIAPSTVNNHVQHILRKLGAHARMDAVRRAEHAGLI